MFGPKLVSRVNLVKARQEVKVKNDKISKRCNSERNVRNGSAADYAARARSLVHSFLAAGNKRPRGVMQSSKVKRRAAEKWHRVVYARVHRTEVPRAEKLPDAHGRFYWRLPAAGRGRRGRPRRWT